MEKLIKCAIGQARCNDFHKVLACLSTIDRPRQSTRVVDGIKLLENIRKAMLVHNNLQPYIVILDQKNTDISNKKPSY